MAEYDDNDYQYSEALDSALQTAIAKLTHGISPAVLLLAYTDWYYHLLLHPAKQTELLHLYKNNVMNLASHLFKNMPGKTDDKLPPLTNTSDKRFNDESWQHYPFNYLYQSFLLTQEWWHSAATDIRGASKHHLDIVDFTIRQYLDALSPYNYPFLNPQVIQETYKRHGENFIDGMHNFLDDYKRIIEDAPPEGADKYCVGKNVATTNGKVIAQNKLMELIQYTPQTKQTFEHPILITPAWIMKYYILDLQPDYSLVEYLISKGHTVFMISWKNPDVSYKNTTMQDYLDLGIRAAVDTIKEIIPNEKINLLGYCLGGTLAAIACAAYARDQDDIISSLTLFASQTDFTEPGELGLFIDESQISFLESMMQQKGFLDTHQMAGAFQLLRSNDLIWSRMLHDYLLGKRKPLNALMAWNSDATRLPYKMHSEYLRNLFLTNQLAEGKYLVDNKPIALTDITTDIFVVATEKDHVSPWLSVFKINLLTSANVTFTLTSGGHNVGIVCPPDTEEACYFRSQTLHETDHYIDPETWYNQTKPIEGSWWPTWEKWLAKHAGNKTQPPKIDANKKGILYDAPGKYVLEK